MVKKTYLLIWLLLPLLCLGQKVVSSSGNTYKSSNLIVSYTVGEIAVATYSNNSVKLTQGFHQKENATSNIRNELLTNTQSVYPNPFTSNLCFDGFNDGCKVLVYNIQGKQMLTKTISADNTQLNLEFLERGFYLLKVVDLNGQQEGIFKVLKTDI